MSELRIGSRVKLKYDYHEHAKTGEEGEIISFCANFIEVKLDRKRIEDIIVIAFESELEKVN